MIDLTNSNIKDLFVKYQSLLEFFPYEKEENVYIIDMGINILKVHEKESKLFKCGAVLLLKKWFQDKNVGNSINIFNVIHEYSLYYDKNYQNYIDEQDLNYGDDNDREISFVYKYLNEKTQ